MHEINARMLGGCDADDDDDSDDDSDNALCCSNDEVDDSLCCVINARTCCFTVRDARRSHSRMIDVDDDSDDDVNSDESA